MGGKFGLGSLRSCPPLIGWVLEVKLSWICHQGIGKKVRKKLRRLLWCATIYFIWHERNHRLHGGQVREAMIIFQLIRLCIRARAAS